MIREKNLKGVKYYSCVDIFNKTKEGGKLKSLAKKSKHFKEVQDEYFGNKKELVCDIEGFREVVEYISIGADKKGYGELNKLYRSALAIEKKEEEAEIKDNLQKSGNKTYIKISYASGKVKALNNITYYIKKANTNKNNIDIKEFEISVNNGQAIYPKQVKFINISDLNKIAVYLSDEKKEEIKNFVSKIIKVCPSEPKITVAPDFVQEVEKLAQKYFVQEEKEVEKLKTELEKLKKENNKLKEENTKYRKVQELITSIAK